MDDKQRVRRTAGALDGQDFEERLARERGHQPASQDALQAPRSGASMGGLALRVGLDFVAPVAVGVGLGYGVDALLDSRPWGLVVLFVLGSAAGFLNVYRATRRFMNEAGIEPRHDP